MAAGAPVGDKLLHQADLRLGQRNQHICLRLRAPVRRIRVLPAEPQGAGHNQSAGHGAVEVFRTAHKHIECKGRKAENDCSVRRD